MPGSGGEEGTWKGTEGGKEWLYSTDWQRCEEKSGTGTNYTSEYMESEKRPVGYKWDNQMSRKKTI